MIQVRQPLPKQDALALESGLQSVRAPFVLSHGCMTPGRASSRPRSACSPLSRCAAETADKTSEGCSSTAPLPQGCWCSNLQVQSKHFLCVHVEIGASASSAVKLLPGAQADQTAQRLDSLLQQHEANERFNPGWLEDESERIVLETVGSVITPLCRQRGRLVLTPLRLYFQPFNVVSDAPLQVFALSKVGLALAACMLMACS